MSAAPIHYEPSDPADYPPQHVGRRMFLKLRDEGALIECIPGAGAVAVIHGVDHYLDPCPSTRDHYGERVMCDEKRGHDGVHANDERGAIWGTC